MLKYELDSLDDLDESLKALYEEADGKFRLKVDGVPKPDNSLADRLKKLEDNNRSLLEEKKKAKDDADKAIRDAAKNSGDIEAIEKSWQDKLSARETELLAELQQRDSLVSGLTVGQTSTSLSAELFGENADLMQHHINKRLTYEVADGKPKVRVLDASGQPTALSLDDLKKEITGNARFAPFLVGSHASGPGSHGKGGSATKKFNEYSSGELVALKNANPKEYARIRDEYHGK